MTNCISEELKALKANASTLTAFVEATGRDDVFYALLDLSTRLDTVSEKFDQQFYSDKTVEVENDNIVHTK